MGYTIVPGATQYKILNDCGECVKRFGKRMEAEAYVEWLETPTEPIQKLQKPKRVLQKKKKKLQKSKKVPEIDIPTPINPKKRVLYDVFMQLPEFRVIKITNNILCELWSLGLRDVNNYKGIEAIIRDWALDIQEPRNPTAVTLWGWLDESVGIDKKLGG